MELLAHHGYFKKSYKCIFIIRTFKISFQSETSVCDNQGDL